MDNHAAGKTPEHQTQAPTDTQYFDANSGDQLLMQPITVISNGSAREAYRVVPDPDDPVILLLEGNLVRVLDISASGFSCPQGDIKAGRRYSFQMDLPSTSHSVQGMVDVLPQPENGQLHCQFASLGPEESDALHQYVLVRQKQAIRELKRRSRENR